MAALSADRNTPRRLNAEYEFTPATGAVIYRGALVCLNASNQLVPGSTATGLRAVGMAENSTKDTGYGGTIKVRRGTHRWGNSASGDLITLSDIGSQCFIVDDQTVAKTSATSTRSVAGIVRDVDASGVWVEI